MLQRDEDQFWVPSRPTAKNKVILKGFWGIKHMPHPQFWVNTLWEKPQTYMLLFLPIYISYMKVKLNFSMEILINNRVVLLLKLLGFHFWGADSKLSLWHVEHEFSRLIYKNTQKVARLLELKGQVCAEVKDSLTRWDSYNSKSPLYVE